ncbi:MAG: NADH-quinone oxidoreductase subunit A [Planctomycetes bacterium]|nr:NADH-quinone oxidoreductase subunit A [Planctomycetota bacterium]
MLAATDQLPPLAVHLGLAVAIPAVIALIAGRLAPRNPSAAKLRPYECGVSEQGGPVTRIPIRFALVGMLFLVFDVEALFFYPWAVVVRELGTRGLGIMFSFLVLLVAGYVYARSRGALEWR